MNTGKAAALLNRLPWYTVPAILLGVPLLAFLLVQVWPDFYDLVIFQYYWGPIAADAAGQALCSGGDPAVFGACPPGETMAQGGYNWVNTISWAVLLGVCITGIAQMLHAFKAEMDDKLIMGAAAWVVAGSVWHVLQDSKLFMQPLEYVFITPPIYLLFGAFGIASFAYGQYVKHVVETTGSLEAGLQKIWFLFMAVVLGYTFLWVADWGQIVHYVNPLWAVVLAIITFAVVRLRAYKTGRLDPSELTMTFSIGWLLMSLVYVWTYLDAPWPGKMQSDELQHAFVTAPLLAAATAGLVYGIAKWRHNAGGKNAWAYLVPMNLMIVFSQMLDAFSTSLGIDLTGKYSEKHILSEFVRVTTEGIGGVFAKYPTFLGFAPIKLAVSLLVIYAIDVQSKDDVKKYPTMIGLVKFAIIMVGLGPGVRNMTRMSLGI